MATLELIKEAILSLKDRTGSSSIAINKWIEAEKKTTIKKHLLKAAFKRGVETGALVQVKNSYKVAPEAKKKVVKKSKPATKKPAAKKTATDKTTKTKKTTAVKKVKKTVKAKAPKKTTATKDKKKTTTKKVEKQ